MAINERAGQSPQPEMLADIPRLITAYYTLHPDVSVAAQKVSFGTSGHRGSAFHSAFNEDHILAITQAICEHRARQDLRARSFSPKTRTGSPNPRSPAR